MAEQSEDQKGNIKTKKVCAFCKEEKIPSYTDVVTLKRFTTDRGKIVSKARSGICSKHQRVMAKEIKHARHLALLPFAVKI